MNREERIRKIEGYIALMKSHLCNNDFSQVNEVKKEIEYQISIYERELKLLQLPQNTIEELKSLIIRFNVNDNDFNSVLDCLEIKAIKDLLVIIGGVVDGKM